MHLAWQIGFMNTHPRPQAGWRDAMARARGLYIKSLRQVPVRLLLCANRVRWFLILENIQNYNWPLSSIS
jgi:hypothetical protein